MIINKHLATRCLAGQNFISSRNIHYKCWRSEIQFLISQTVKKKLLSLKIFCPVQVYALLKTLLRVATADQTIIYLSLVQLHVQIVISWSSVIRANLVLHQTFSELTKHAKT